MTCNSVPTHCLLLAQKIGAIFENGLTLSEDARHYIESTFLCPSWEELQEIFSDSSGCETESLLELIFFPDEAIQLELEELLAAYPFEQKDEKRVIAALFARPVETVLILPGDRRLIMSVPQAAAAQFVARLNISRKIDARINAAISRHVPPVHQNRFRVRLRNARLTATENRALFLSAFFEKMEAGQETVLACFDFLLDFLDELPSDDAFYRALMDKKRFYSDNLQKAIRSEQQLANSNIETLLLSGGRVVYVDKQDARRNIRLIDRIAYALFGRSEPLGPQAAEMNLGDYYREDGLKTVFRMLA